jgi:hypothetical protein
MKMKFISVFSLLALFVPGLFAQSSTADSAISTKVKTAVSSLAAKVTSPVSLGIGALTISTAGSGDTGSTSPLANYLRGLVEHYAVNAPNFRVASDTEMNDFINKTDYSHTRSLAPLG